MKMLELFPVPIYIGKVKHHEEVKQIISSKINNGTTPKRWNCSVNSSYDSPLTVGNSDMYEIPLTYKDNYDEYFKLFNIKCSINLLNVWYNEYTKHQYQEQHHHLPADISCIHYIKLDKDHSGTTFINPLNLLTSSNKLMTVKSPHTFTPYVEEGMMIIFPSYLEHYVLPQTSDSSRITLSWNFNITSLENQN